MTGKPIQRAVREAADVRITARRVDADALGEYCDTG
jgi:hypothetical protein